MSENETEETGDPNKATLNLDVPEQLQYTADHVWVEDDDELLTIGITEYAASKMGELVYVDLPEPGDEVRAGDEIVEMESAKAVQSLICPVDGTVRYVNREVADDPSIINGDPYGEGWILKVEPSDDEPDLMDSEQYAAMVGNAQ